MSSTLAMKNARRAKRTPYLFILPWVIGVLLFTAGPLLMSLVMSFFNWPVIGTPEFLGVGNYVRMMTEDKQFWESLRITFTFTFIFVPLKIALALFMAVIITKPLRFANGIRTIFYMPTVVSSVAVSIIWGWILNTEYGIMNFGLSKLGITGPDWLNNKASAMGALVLASAWSVGALMLIFYTALRSISVEIYEAATIDGSNQLTTFFRITLPLITPTLLFNIVTSEISTLQNLDLVMLLTKGGPLMSTYMYGLYVYRNAFDKSQLGYAAANAWVMFIIILILTGLIFKSSSIWVYNQTPDNRAKVAGKKG